MKKLKTLIITIFLGALGSACWEWVLKPLFLFIYERIVMYSIHLFSDSFYSKVARSIDSPASLTYYYVLIIIAVLILMPPRFFYNMFHRQSSEKADAILKTALKFYGYITITYMAFSTVWANQIARTTLREIEIIAPYVSDIEYKTLKSDFYRMDSKADYIELTTHIESVMMENHLTE